MIALHMYFFAAHFACVFLLREIEFSISFHHPDPVLTYRLVCQRQVISENSMISYVHRSPSTRRYFTTCCGTRLFFTHHDANMQIWGLYPALFPTCLFPTPSLEVHVRESRVHDLKLVAYSDLPVEFGGSGKRMDEALLDSKEESETEGNSDVKGKQEEN